MHAHTHCGRSANIRDTKLSRSTLVRDFVNETKVVSLFSANFIEIATEMSTTFYAFCYRITNFNRIIDIIGHTIVNIWINILMGQMIDCVNFGAVYMSLLNWIFQSKILFQYNIVAKVAFFVTCKAKMHE